MNDIPFIITDEEGRALLKSAAPKELKKVGYFSDVSKYLFEKSRDVLASIPDGSSGAVALGGLGRYRFALVFKKLYRAACFYTFLLLDTDASETAYLARDAALLCEGVRGAKEAPLSEKLYLLDLKLRNLKNDMTLFLSGGIGRRPFPELIDELERGAANIDMRSSKLRIRYENGSFAPLYKESFSSLPFCALLVLCSIAAGLSSDKNLTLSISYAERTAAFELKTAVKNSPRVICRGEDIFEAGIADDAMRPALALCSELLGAQDNKIYVSLDGASGKSILSFEYRLKSYDKRPAGIKVDDEFANE